MLEPPRRAPETRRMGTRRPRRAPSPARMSTSTASRSLTRRFRTRPTKSSGKTAPVARKGGAVDVGVEPTRDRRESDMVWCPLGPFALRLLDLSSEQSEESSRSGDVRHDDVDLIEREAPIYATSPVGRRQESRKRPAWCGCLSGRRDARGSRCFVQAVTGTPSAVAATWRMSDSSNVVVQQANSSSVPFGSLKYSERTNTSPSSVAGS